MRRAAAIWITLLAAACSDTLGGGGGGGDGSSGLPIRSDDDVPELLYCRTRTESSSDSQIRWSTARGLAEARVLDRTGIERDVRLHPDGNRFAFTREPQPGRPESREIYTGSLDGSVPLLRLTVNGQRDDAPTWSPDGTRIAFVSERLGQGPRLFVAGDDGSDARPLYDDGSDQEHPDWSAALDRLAFSRSGGGAGPKSIWIVDADGRLAAPATDGGTGVGDRHPTFLPDGSGLVFVRELEPGRARLAHVDLATGSVTFLTDAEGDCARPRVSPTADRIVFAASRPGAGIEGLRLFTARLDGSEPSILFGDLRYEFLGVDFLPATRPLPSDPMEVAPADLTTASVRNGLGRVARGSTDQLLVADEAVLGLMTAASGSREVAGLELEIPLPVAEARDVQALEIRVVATLAEPSSDAVLRVALANFEASRNDTIVARRPANSSLLDLTFRTTNLQHVSEDARVRVAVVGENGFEQPTELWIDAIIVEVVRPLAASGGTDVR